MRRARVSGVRGHDVPVNQPQPGSFGAVEVTDAPPAGVPHLEPAPLTPRAITLAASTVLTSVLVAVAAVLPMPYAISSPGPTKDTLGEESGKPLIAVEGEETFPASGELLLTTVSVAGGPDYPVGLAQVVHAWFARERSVTPVELVFQPSVSRDEVDAQNQAAMISSQENATVAALEELGYEVPTVLTVSDVMPGTGAAEVVEAQDVIVAVGGQDVLSFSDLSAAMDEVDAGDDVEVGVLRDGERVDLTVTTGSDDQGESLLGVYIDPEFDLPVDVTIQIENIGGPSAGTMFALGIIDKLTEADEANGTTIAGTGTMDLTGTVGPIGGIRQKLFGALEDGATWVLAPEANCGDVVGNVPDGLRVVSVGTLSEAREAVEAIGAGDTEGLPTCE